MKILKMLAVAAALLATGCGRGQPPAGSGARAGTPGESAGVAEEPRVELGAAAQLDSGNTAYRAHDYQGALGHYRKAAEREPRLAAAWFGIYMARNALGDKAGADSAMRMVQSIAPGTMGAHPAEAGAPGATAGPLPPGHPSVGPGAPGPSAPSGRSPARP